VERAWRTADRLTADDEAEIVRLFMIGTAKTALAEKYGISESSVKRLLRKHGVRRTSWADRQPA
jgi:DNA invertase Pin-like site-specific DNA recombinase